MATMHTASRRRPRLLAALAAVLALMFVSAQGTALAHEIEHVLHLHEAPCALHVAADHLVMAPAPDPEPAVALAPASRAEPSTFHAVPAPPARPSAARAPPVRS
ncbi:MAG TPA: hypothetical protein VNC82_22890 [Candidatus Limnocylindria bacterium]|nr:hypothetical protein [Candidatus Limnocylindria bacterium]